MHIKKIILKKLLSSLMFSSIPSSEIKLSIKASLSTLSIFDLILLLKKDNFINWDLFLWLFCNLMSTSLPQKRRKRSLRISRMSVFLLKIKLSKKPFSLSLDLSLLNSLFFHLLILLKLYHKVSTKLREIWFLFWT
jgi:hypothetical protein